MALLFKHTRWAALVILIACSRDPAAQSAANGDVAGLRAQLQARVLANKLHSDDVVEIAKKTLEYEVHHLVGPHALNDLRGLAPCARAVKSFVWDVVDAHGELAGAAALFLVEHDLVSSGTFTDRRDDKDPFFRAAGTRGLTDENERKLREARVHDDDLYVRRMAALATGDGTLAEFESLKDVARTDPDPVVAIFAIRSMIKLAARADANARAPLVLQFGDLLESSRNEVRSTLLSAFGHPDLFAFGGRNFLEKASADAGLTAVDAAAYWMMRDPEGEDRVLQFAQSNDSVRAAYALRRLSLSRPKSREFIEKQLAAKAFADLQQLAVAQLFAANESTIARAKDILRTLTASQDDEIAFAANVILARLLEPSARNRLVSELARVDSAFRNLAVNTLSQIGHAEDAWQLLSSDDRAVRIATACNIVAK